VLVGPRLAVPILLTVSLRRQGAGESFESAGVGPVGGSALPVGVEADQVEGDGGDDVF
jgi:hypothetical protein